MISVCTSFLCILMILSAVSSMRYVVRRSFNKRQPLLMHCLHNKEPSVSSYTEYNNITLLPEEKQVVEMLNNVVREYKLNTQIRIAGGWVRDRLLGISGKYDIDIALDNMTGSRFSTHLVKWNSENGLEYVKFTVIQQNPSKSKHLETVTAKIGPFSVDFVNLRTETYQQNSRIPQAEFGTPLEDALRRDLTINSLFYNIHTGKIEDFTKMGIHDIQHKLIRTPLPALVTLTDDPLRCLRAIRFACRLGFDFDQELASAVSQPVVLEALEIKISKERVLVELELMFELLSAVRAVVILHQFKLLPFILALPDIPLQNNSAARLLPAVPLPSYSNASLAAVLIVDRFCRQKEIAAIASDAHIGNLVKEIGQHGEVRMLFMFALLTAPSVGFEIVQATKKSTTLAQQQLQVRLKMKRSHVNQVGKLHAKALHFAEILRSCLEYSNNSPDVLLYSAHSVMSSEGDGPTFGPVTRLNLGLACRESGEQYRSALLIAMSGIALHRMLTTTSPLSPSAAPLSLAQVVDSLMHSHSVGMYPLSDGQLEKELLLVQAAGSFVMRAIDAMQLEGVWSMPLLLDGTKIQAIFKNIPMDGAFKSLMSEQLAWQLKHPHGTTAQLESHLKELYSSFL